MTIPQGVALGVDAGSSIAEAAVSRMGQRAAGAYHPGGFSGGHGGGSGSGNVTIHNETHVTVQGSVMAEHDLANTVQNVLLKKGSNNWQAGLVLPGRSV